MKDKATYSTWNFDTLWAMDGVGNSGYPYLKKLASEPLFEVCDVNKDGVVSIEDLKLVAEHYNTRSTDINWDSAVDFNSDGVINIFDLVICSKRIE
jgi:Ca2+-binding EF-hand superfamily protein